LAAGETESKGTREAILITGENWTLYQADYRETLRIVAEQGGCDLVATSPPYCDCRTYGAGVSWGDADYAALGDAVFSALKPGGHALINVDAPVREWRKGFGTERGFHPWKMMIDWAERVGFRVPDRLAFGRQGLPGAYGGRFRNDWEPLLWFQKPGEGGYFDASSLAIPAKWGRAVGTKTIHGVNADGSRPTKGYSGYNAENNLKARGTLWEYGATGGSHSGADDIEATDHPARWPFKLAEDIILCFCPKGGLVCDPFCGAGTTGAAAIAHDRRFVGGDLYARNDGKTWAEIAAGILTERQRQLRLF
jgi:DNA modification methylase